MQEIEIKGQIISMQHGVLKTGDVLRVSDEVAHMLCAQGSAQLREAKEAQKAHEVEPTKPTKSKK